MPNFWGRIQDREDRYSQFDSPHQTIFQDGPFELNHIGDGAGALYSMPWQSHKDEVYEVYLDGALENLGNLAGRGQAEQPLKAALLYVIHEYDKLGCNAFRKIRGAFRLLIWDKRRKELVIVRDKLGYLPLVWHKDNYGFQFASNLKTLLNFGHIPRKLNDKLLADVFLNGFISGQESLLKGVFSVPPGHALIFLQGKEPRQQAYWDIIPPETTPSGTGDFLEQTEILLLRSIRLKSALQPRNGLLLSSGTDSTLLGAYLKRITPNGLAAFTAGYHGFVLDESSRAAEVAKYLGIPHNVYYTNDESDRMLKDLERFVYTIEEPNKFGVMLSLIPLLERVRESHDSVFTGGCSETFFGESGYVRAARIDTLSHLPLTLRKPIHKITRFFEHHNLARRWMTPLSDILLLSKDHMFTYYFCCNPNPLLPQKVLTVAPLDPSYAVQKLLSLAPKGRYSRYAYIQFKTFGEMTVKTGRALSDLTKVRVLQPFIDEEIVPFTFTIPDDRKVKGKVPKVILRKLQSRYIPKNLIRKDKLGITSKINDWIRHNKSLSQGEELLQDRTTQERGLYDRKSLQAILNG